MVSEKTLIIFSKRQDIFEKIRFMKSAFKILSIFIEYWFIIHLASKIKKYKQKKIVYLHKKSHCQMIYQYNKILNTWLWKGVADYWKKRFMKYLCL